MTASRDDADSPGKATSGTFKLQFRAAFTNYLMFRPIVLTPWIPVPIKKFEWSVNGVATNDLTNWRLLSSPNDFSVPVNNAETVEFPTWTNNTDNAIISYTNSF
jgi:hypothetical protein